MSACLFFFSMFLTVSPDVHRQMVVEERALPPVQHFGGHRVQRPTILRRNPVTTIFEHQFDSLTKMRLLVLAKCGAQNGRNNIVFLGFSFCFFLFSILFVGWVRLGWFFAVWVCPPMLNGHGGSQFTRESFGGREGPRHAAAAAVPVFQKGFMVVRLCKNIRAFSRPSRCGLCFRLFLL